MVGFGDLFGSGSIGEQFLVWGVLQQLLQPIMGPLVAEVGKLVNSAAPDQPIDLGSAVQAAARQLIDDGTGRDKANDLGIGGQDYELLVKLGQHAPDLTIVFEAWRRQLIEVGNTDPEEVSVNGALTDQGIRPAWLPIIRQLATQIPTVPEVMNAWLEGQIGPDEAQRRYLEAGGDPSWFQTAYNANGQAPTPMEALDMLNRGIIPSEGAGPDSISYHQAFLEGPWRNKWEAPFRGLAEYYPPPRTVTAMYHEAQLSHDEAAMYLAKQGLSPSLIAAYLSAGTHQATVTDKTLTKADLLTLYTDRIITRDEAKAQLVALHYHPGDAELMLELADARVKASQVTSAVTRIKDQFLLGELDGPGAQNALAKLGIPAGQGPEIVAVWRLEQQRAAKTLSPAQIAGAWYYSIISTDEALRRIEQAGYSPRDAWIMLAERQHGPLKQPPMPAR